MCGGSGGGSGGGSKIDTLTTSDGKIFRVARNISPSNVDFKPGDASYNTANDRSKSMIDTLKRGGSLRPPQLKQKPGGRFEVYDGNARVTAYKKLNRKFDAILVD